MIVECAGSPNVKRILVFGFSVTELKDGYFATVANLLDKEYELTKIGIGGASLSVVPYLSTILKYHHYDYVLFEIGTCIRFAEEQPAKYDDLISEIIDACRRSGALACFVNLFRDKINYEHDNLSRAIESSAKSNNLPFLDLIRPLIKIKHAGEMANYLYDGTHTTPNGAIYYGQKIAKFIRTLPNWANTIKLEVVTNKVMFLIEGFCDSHGEMSRGGLKLPFSKLEEGRALKGTVPIDMKFRGLIFIMGPDTGVFEVSSSKITRKVNAYDQFCYYERFSYWLRNESNSHEFYIRQTVIEPAVTLKKGQPFSGPKVGRLVGIFAERCCL